MQEKRKKEVGPLDNLRPVYRVEDRERIREGLKIGQGFVIHKKQEDGSREEIRYQVVEKFRFHASCINSCGQRRSFDYFDLDRILGGVI